MKMIGYLVVGGIGNHEQGSWQVPNVWKKPKGLGIGTDMKNPSVSLTDIPSNYVGPVIAQ